MRPGLKEARLFLPFNGFKMCHIIALLKKNMKRIVYVSWVWVETSKDDLKHFEASRRKGRSQRQLQPQSRVLQGPTQKAIAEDNYRSADCTKTSDKPRNECWINPQILLHVWWWHLYWSTVISSFRFPLVPYFRTERVVLQEICSVFLFVLTFNKNIKILKVNNYTLPVKTRQKSCTNLNKCSHRSEA